MIILHINTYMHSLYIKKINKYRGMLYPSTIIDMEYHIHELKLVDIMLQTGELIHEPAIFIMYPEMRKMVEEGCSVKDLQLYSMRIFGKQNPVVLLMDWLRGLSLLIFHVSILVGINIKIVYEFKNKIYDVNLIEKTSYLSRAIQIGLTLSTYWILILFIIRITRNKLNNIPYKLFLQIHINYDYTILFYTFFIGSMIVFYFYIRDFSMSLSEKTLLFLKPLLLNNIYYNATILSFIELMWYVILFNCSIFYFNFMATVYFATVTYEIYNALMFLIILFFLRIIYTLFGLLPLLPALSVLINSKDINKYNYYLYITMITRYYLYIVPLLRFIRSSKRRKFIIDFLRTVLRKNGAEDAHPDIIIYVFNGVSLKNFFIIIWEDVLCIRYKIRSLIRIIPMFIINIISLNQIYICISLGFYLEDTWLYWDEINYIYFLY